MTVYVLWKYDSDAPADEMLAVFRREEDAERAKELCEAEAESDFVTFGVVPWAVLSSVKEFIY